MKKFILTSLAALFAVVSFAQVGLVKNPLPMGNVLTGKMEKNVESLKPMVKNLKPTVNLLAKKNLRRAGISAIDELQGDFVLGNYEFDFNDDGELEANIPSRSASSLSIEAVDANHVMIYGFWDADKGITAEVDFENSKLIIPVGQAIGTSATYGDISIRNAEAEDATAPLTATIYDGSYLEIDQYWYASVVYQEKDARYTSFNQSFIALANGIHECATIDKKTQQPIPLSSNVYIEQDEETKAVTVWNYNPNWNLVVDFDIYSDKSFIVPEQVVYYSSQNGEFNLYGVSGNSLVDLAGTVTETELISDLEVYVYKIGAGGWSTGTFGKITLIDGSQFVIPSAEVGELVVAPEGLVTKEYPVYASAWYNEKNEAQGAYQSTVKLGKEGSDVYIQGLDKDLPEAWVKGTFNATGDTLVIPVTYTGAYNDAAHFMAAYGGTPKDLSLLYDKDADTYEYGATVMCYKGSAATSFNYFMNGFFIGVPPTPTVAPDGLKTIEMPVTGSYMTDDDEEPKEYKDTVMVGWDGNDLYIRDLFTIVDGGWIKGTRNGDKVVFAKNQYIGNLSNSLSCYLTGYDTEAKAVGDVVFTFNETDNYFKADTHVIATRFKNSSRYEAFFAKGLTIGVDPNAAGISVAKAEKNGNGLVYNLAGQRVSKDYKGLVIKNGKKFVIK